MKKATRVDYDPFSNRIKFQISQSTDGPWEELGDTSELLSYTLKPILFSNCASDIVSIINKKQNSVTEGLEIQFVGPQDDFELLRKVVRTEYSQHAGAGPLTARHVGIYDDAESTLDAIKACFERISDEFSDYLPGRKLYDRENKPIGDGIVAFEKTVSDAIPICVIGNYSVGKSALLNSLIGEEILPSKENPTTAKNVEIIRSDRYAISIEYEDGEESTLCSFTVSGGSLSLEGSHGDVAALVYEELKRDVPGPFSTEVELIRALLDRLNVPIEDQEGGVLSRIGWNVVLELPFTSSLLSNADNKIVFFDTPGSDNAVVDKEKHTGALRYLMGDQTNALPILVTSRDKLASQDVVEIKNMLDEFSNNFASPSCLIVISKCDQLTRGQLDEPIPPAFLKWHGRSIVLYTTPVGALGCRKREGAPWLDENYEEHFERWIRNRHDGKPIMLPDYNVYPCENRASDVKRLVDRDLFATGIPCLENEILFFIEKHSKYKKCERGREDLLEAIARVKERLSDQERINLQARERSQEKKDHEKKRMLAELDSMALPVVQDLDVQLYNEFAWALDKYCDTLPEVMGSIYDVIPKDNPLAMDNAFNKQMCEHCQANLITKVYESEGGIKQRIVEMMNSFAEEYADSLQSYVSQNQSHFSSEGSRMLEEKLQQHKRPPTFNVPSTLLDGIGDLFEMAALGHHTLLRLIRNDEHAKAGWIEAKESAFERKLRPSRSFFGSESAGAFVQSTIIPPLKGHYEQLQAWVDDYRELIKGQLEDENTLLSGIEGEIQRLEAEEADLRARLEAIRTAEETLQHVLDPHTMEAE